MLLRPAGRDPADPSESAGVLPVFRSRRSQLAFPVTLVVTLAVALLPAAWRLRWSRDLAEVVMFPIRPFTHAVSAFGAWVRPAPSSWWTAAAPDGWTAAASSG